MTALAFPDTPAPGDEELLAALRRGDQRAFAGLVERLHRPMLRVAMAHVGNRAVAEEVVQETWLAVVRQLDRFEGRSSLRTWIFRILSNRAKTRWARERRSVPLSDFAASDELPEPAVHGLPEDRLLASETATHLGRAVDGLPASQRAVLILRDVQGWTAPEVCERFGLTEGNQRVLLHRARSKVRRALGPYLAA